LLLLLCLPNIISAAEVKVAVASNFLSTLRQIKTEFEKETGHKILVSAASTGKLYAQISHGAPFEVFLAADSLRPKLAEENGLAEMNSRYAYASGRLAVWSASEALQGKDCRKWLATGQYQRIAIANPKTAPYGEAAMQVLKKMQLWPEVKPKLVRGENIGQAFQYVSTGNAQLGLVAMSQVLDPKNRQTSCYWEVPASYHQSLEQHLVVLKKGTRNTAVSDFVNFIKSARVKKIIAANGYGV